MSPLIYVVEDDAKSRRLLKDVLTFHGYTISEFETGESALARLDEALGAVLPALVLLDIQLPGISGFDVLRAVRAHPGLAAVKVVAVTASVMDHDCQRIRAAGFDGYLPKPVNLDALLQMVATLTGGLSA